MIFARVFLPFALGFLFSYILRVVNAVIAPSLIRDIGIGAGDLGLLTSVNFFALAAFQLPLGVLLDRYGPRKTEATLLLIAACGTALFAVADTLSMLLAGRALMGLGTSACLMAAFTAYALWLPKDKLPTINAYQMVAGGLGALVGTTPVEFLQEAVGWRGVFWVLTLLCIALAALIFVAVPRRETPEAASESWGAALGGIGQVYKHPAFLCLAPVCVLNQANYMGIQSLWLGPWFRDVLGLDGRDTADALFLVASAMIASYLALAWTTSVLHKRGVGTVSVAMTGMITFNLTQLAIVFGILPETLWSWVIWVFAGGFGVASYASITHEFPTQLVGRVVTGINVLVFMAAFAVQWGVGEIIDLWPRSASGGFAPEGYAWAFGVTALCQVAATVWYFVFRQRAGARSPA